MPVRQTATTLAARFLTSLTPRAASLVALALGGCSSQVNSSFLNPYGPVAAAQRSLFFEVIGWMMIVVLPVFVLVPLFAWRYRHRNVRAAYRPDWGFSKPLELAIWGVPILVVAVLGYGAWTKQLALDPYRPIASEVPPLDIQVVGLDWKWLFIYPEQGIATVGTVAFPVDRPVRLSLTTDSVMQSFFIPALGSQIYAMAGMVTKLHLIADRPGDTLGENTQYSGNGFYQQRFTASALPKPDFERWVADARSTGRPLNADTYAILAQRGTAGDARAAFGMEAGTLRFVVSDNEMFQRIVERYREGATAAHLPGHGAPRNGRQADSIGTGGAPKGRRP